MTAQEPTRGALASVVVSGPRTLYFGDLSASGFGTVTLGLGRALLDRGLDVRFISQNNFTSLPEPFASRTVDAVTFVNELNAMTGLLDGMAASSAVAELIRGNTIAKTVTGQPWGEWRPQAIVLLGDYLATRILVAQAPDEFESIPAFHYVPIEGVDLPPRWNDLWQVVTPVAMSTFGADQIEKVTGIRPAIAFHGVDTTAFHPVTPQNPVILNPPNVPPIRLTTRDACKHLWAAYFAQNMPKVWLLRTDRHMPRKRYNSMIRALLPVLARQANVALIIHCQPWDQGGMLPDTISKIPGVRMLNPETEHKPLVYGLFDRDYPQIVLTNAVPMDRSALVSLYNAADVYLSTSAEGFGLTIAEALSCGVPAVAMDYSAVPEVVGPAGILVRPAGLIDNEYDHAWAAVDEQEFGQRVEYLATHQAKREELGRRGPAHIASHFRWTDAAGVFDGLIRAAVTASGATSHPASDGRPEASVAGMSDE